MINAYEYGKALFELASEQNMAEEMLTELVVVADILKENPDYVTLLDTPAIAANEKPQLIDEAFGSCHVYVRDFIKILSAGKAVSQLKACVETYSKLLDESLGILRAEVVTAVAMTESQCSRMAEKLSVMTDKRIVLTNHVDAAVIGGVILNFDGTRLDGSIRSKLDGLKKELKNAHI